MSNYNLREMWNKTKTDGVPLLGNFTDSRLSFMNEYNTDFTQIDRMIGRTKGFFYPIWNNDEIQTDNIQDVITDFQADVFALLVTHQNDLQRIYNVSKEEYAPIENYKMNESGHDTITGDNSTTQKYGNIVTNSEKGQQTDNHTFGEIQNTNEYGSTSKKLDDTTTVTDTTTTDGTHTDTIGEKTTTNNVGSVTNTDVMGNKENSDTIGQHTDVTENGVAGYNSASFTSSDNTTTNFGAQTNTHSETSYTDTHETGAHTDSTVESSQTNSTTIDDTVTSNNTNHKIATETENAHTDTETISQHVDSVVEGSRKDSETVTRQNDETTNTQNQTNTHEFERHGNIGVTTSQQMIQSEIDLWNSFNFYTTVIDLIVRELCTFYDDGYETFLTPLRNSLM